MLEKKSSKGNLDRRRNTFLIIGFVFAIGLIYVGLELFTTKEKPTDFGKLREIEIFVIDETVKPTDPTPPEPLKTAPPELILKPVDKEGIQLNIDTLFKEFKEGDDIPVYETIEIIDIPVDPAPPVHFPEEMPEPMGGMAAMYKFLQDNLKYPEKLRTTGIGGQVLIEFVVEKDGNVSNVNVLAPVHPDLDNEAVRVIKMLPKWKPGKQGGKTVRSYYQIPIRFTIQ